MDDSHARGALIQSINAGGRAADQSRASLLTNYEDPNYVSAVDSNYKWIDSSAGLPSNPLTIGSGSLPAAPLTSPFCRVVVL